MIAASEALYVHPNTFRYRLRRLAEVGEINLGDPEAAVRRDAPAAGSRTRHRTGRLNWKAGAPTRKGWVGPMPWFPDFVSAAELARKETRAAGLADPVGQYLTALSTGDTHALETVWPGEVVVLDPRAGEVRGHHQLRQFVQRSKALLAERNARIETVATTGVEGRAVVELLVHLDVRRARRCVAGGGRRGVPRRPVGGVPHVLQPVAGRRPAPPPGTDPGAAELTPGGCRRPLRRRPRGR